MKKSFSDLGIIVKNGQTYAPINRLWFDYMRNPRIDYADCLPQSVDWNPAGKDEIDATKNIKTEVSASMYDNVFTNGVLVPVEASLLIGDELTRAHTMAAKFGLTPAGYGDMINLSPKQVKEIALRGIRGHRRFFTLVQLHKLYPRDEKFAYIPVNIHENLTYQMELDMLIDQGGVKGLNSCELVNAIKTLRSTGLSEVAIASRLNVSRGFVQRRVWIIGFPQFVFDAWVNYMLKREKTVQFNLTDTRLVELYKCATEDRKNGRDLSDPESKFMERWNKYLAPSTSADGTETGGEASTGNNPKMKTRLQAQALMDENKDLDTIITSTIQLMMGNNDVSLHTLNGECKMLRIKAARYDEMNKAQAETPKAKKNGTNK